jgi:hypothetical protein
MIIRENMHVYYSKYKCIYKFSIAVFFPWQFLHNATKLSTWLEPPESNLIWWSISNHAGNCCLQFPHNQFWLDLKQLQSQHHREAKRLQEKWHQLSIKPNNELTDKFIKSCHSGRSVAKTRNPNELKGIIETYCHSARSVAKTRNPGVLFKILSLSLAV